MNSKKFLGYFLFLISLFFLSTSLTGAAIGTNISESSIFVLGIVFFMGGLTLILMDNLESKLDFYSSGRGDARTYHLKDPNAYLTMHGYDMSLNEFKEIVEEMRDSPEIMKDIRKHYLPEFKRVEKEGGEKAKIAREFMKVIAEDELKKGRGDKEKYELSKKEKRKIKSAFTQIRGGPDKKQRRILNKYGFHIEITGGNHIKYSLGDESTISPLTTSDIRAGKNLASKLIKIIERNYPLGDEE